MSGRPRDPELEKRLLSAAWSLLTTNGYDSLTLTKVASEAGAHRTDVYRRWATKAQLVTDVLAVHLPPVPAKDTGTLRSDIRAYVGGLADSWGAPWIDGLVGLLGDLRHDPDAELAFRVLAQGRGEPMRMALERALERGEITDMPDLHLAGGLLEGPLMHRRMIALLPLDNPYLDALADAAYQVLTGIRITA